jgi:hypothetical protein
LFVSANCGAIIEIITTSETWTLEFGALKPVAADAPLSNNNVMSIFMP